MMGYNMSSSSLVHCHALLPHVQPKRRTRLSNTLRFEHRFIEQYTIHVLPVLASSLLHPAPRMVMGAGWSVALSYGLRGLNGKLLSIDEARVAACLVRCREYLSLLLASEQARLQQRYHQNCYTIAT